MLSAEEFSARWLSLFELTNSYKTVYTLFDVLKRSGHFIVGYTMIPSHGHAIIAFNL